MTMEMFNQGMAMGRKAFEDMVVQTNKMIRDMLEDKETGGEAETSSCARHLTTTLLQKTT